MTYYFDIREDGILFRDEIGVELASVSDVRVEAQKLSIEVIRESKLSSTRKTVAVDVRRGDDDRIYTAKLELVGGLTDDLAEAGNSGEAQFDILANRERVRSEADTPCEARDAMARDLIVVDGDGRADALPSGRAHVSCGSRPLNGMLKRHAARNERTGLSEPLRPWRETSDLALRAAERAACEGERRYRLFAENINDVIIESDPDFTRRYVSPSVKAVLGHEPADLVGGHPADLVHPDDLEACLRVGEEVRSGQRERGLLTLRCHHKDGHWVWLEMSSRLLVDAEMESPGGMLATLRDVTARKLAEDRLRFGEARHRALVDALPQMIVIASAETGEASFTNRQFEHYFGWVAPSSAARIALVHPDDVDRYQDLWVNARARQGRYEGEMRLRRREGAYRWHKVVMVPVVQDAAICTVVSTALDINEIVTARRDLERTSDLLRLAQAAAGAGVWEWDSGSGRISLSPASARMHGLSAGIGETAAVMSLATWKACVVSEDRSSALAALRRDPAEGTANAVEYRTLTPELTGSQRWVQSFAHFTPGVDGERVVGLHLDVTARREAEEALRTREAKLRVSEERLSLALESGDDGLFDADLERNTHWVSRRWVERLGYDAEASHNPLGFWMDCIHPDDVGHVAADMDARRRAKISDIENEHRLRRADGRYIWVMARARVVAWNDQGEPLRIVGTLIDVSQRKESELRIRHLAEHDALTGLPNRRVIDRWLAEAVERASREPDRHAVLVCDIDRFKAVNDTLGHRVGDLVLCAAAARLRAAVRPQDVVARLGGDEFAVLLADIDGCEGTTLLCERIIAALVEPLDTDCMPVTIGISIGAATLSADGAGAEEMFKRADVALYEAKAGGRNTYRLFEVETHARATSRSLLALDLPAAMRRGEFSLVFQPIIDVETGTASTCEALMRWSHPKRGPISPAEFIPVAEDTGAIIPLGAWALTQACREAMAWPDDVRIAVNVSNMQMAYDIERKVQDALDQSCLPPHRLILEITESALMHNAEQAAQTLCRLKKLGVRIALDDFGTGYSSLSYLRMFPFDTLKIDRSFIRDTADPDAAAIVRAVMSIGERLGMDLVVEGVETEEQLDLVKREGCRHVQGFLFSRPLPAAEVRTYLAVQQRG